MSKSSVDHLGLLLFGIFNASIPKRYIPKDWKFIQGEAEDGSDSYWVNEYNEPVEKELTFTLHSIESGRYSRVVSYIGTLIKSANGDSIEGKNKLDTANNNGNNEDGDEEEEEEDDDEDDDDDDENEDEDEKNEDEQDVDNDSDDQGEQSSGSDFDLKAFKKR